MTYTMKPLSFAPDRLTGFSKRLIVSHYENNYGGPFTWFTAKGGCLCR
jgi:superoxide dismutase, Fe-Mn family